MSKPTQTPKRVITVASTKEDRSLFMGSLVYRTGLELPLLEKLQKAGKTAYVDIIPYMRGEKLEPTFHTPKHLCVFVENPVLADVVVCVLRAGATNSDVATIIRDSDIEKAVANEASLVVVVDEMQEVNWVQAVYENLCAIARATVESAYDRKIEALFLPISSRHGDNFLEISAKSPWFSQRTLPSTVVEAIDH